MLRIVTFNPILPWGPDTRPVSEPPEPLEPSPDTLVTVKEPGVYRVKWDVGSERFVLVPVHLDF